MIQYIDNAWKHLSFSTSLCRNIKPQHETTTEYGFPGNAVELKKAAHLLPAKSSVKVSAITKLTVHCKFLEVTLQRFLFPRFSSDLCSKVKWAFLFCNGNIQKTNIWYFLHFSEKSVYFLCDKKSSWNYCMQDGL